MLVEFLEEQFAISKLAWPPYQISFFLRLLAFLLYKQLGRYFWKKTMRSKKNYGCLGAWKVGKRNLSPLMMEPFICLPPLSPAIDLDPFYPHHIPTLYSRNFGIQELSVTIVISPLKKQDLGPVSTELLCRSASHFHQVTQIFFFFICITKQA